MRHLFAITITAAICLISCTEKQTTNKSTDVSQSTNDAVDSVSQPSAQAKVEASISPQTSDVLRTIVSYPTSIVRDLDYYARAVQPLLPDRLHRFSEVWIDHFDGSDGRNSPESTTKYTYAAEQGLTQITVTKKAEGTGEPYEQIFLTRRAAPKNYLQQFTEIEDITFDRAEIMVVNPPGAIPKALIDLYLSGQLIARYVYEPRNAVLITKLEEFSLPARDEMTYVASERYRWFGENQVEVTWWNFTGQGTPFTLGADPKTGILKTECGVYVCADAFDPQQRLVERNYWNGGTRIQRNTYEYAEDSVTETIFMSNATQQVRYALNRADQGLTLRRQDDSSNLVTQWDFESEEKPATYSQTQDVVTSFGEVSLVPIKTHVISYKFRGAAQP